MGIKGKLCFTIFKLYFQEFIERKRRVRSAREPTLTRSRFFLFTFFLIYILLLKFAVGSLFA